mmetsp:Transcript_23487/g.37617  ORF Transcript_23487/g.37617 Transcript_23487/m.37617 type:complete len:328 (+) Transcript_23487:46-1029(+)
MTESNPLLGVATAAVASNVAGNVASSVANRGNSNRSSPADDQVDYSGVCGCCRWFCSGPFCVKKRLIFLGWIVVAALSPLLFAVYLAQDDEGVAINYGFIAICCLAILTAGYATLNFRDVIALRDACESLVNSTKALAVQRDKIRSEVEKLQTAHVKLEGIEDQLQSSNNALRNNFKKFETWNTTIKEEVAKNVDNAQTINKEFKEAIKQYQRMLVQNEKAILDKAYQHIQGRDGEDGLSKDEFADLLNSLPARYKLRFESLGKRFEDFDDDGNGTIDYTEFKKFMEEMAEEQGTAGVDLPEISNKRNRGPRMEQEYDDEEDEEKRN